MIATHGAWALYKDIGPLACLPRSLEKVIYPPTELKDGLSSPNNQLKECTNLLNTLLKERHGESTILNTYTHKLRRISADVSEFNAMLQCSSAWQ